MASPWANLAENYQRVPESMAWDYVFARDGAIVSGTDAFSPWMNVERVSQMTLRGDAFATGTTVITVQLSNDSTPGTSKRVDYTNAVTLAGETQANMPFQYARVRINQTVANNTAGVLSAKFTD